MSRCVCACEGVREVLLRVGSGVGRRGRCTWRQEGGGGEESREMWGCRDGDVCERGKCAWQGLGGCVELEVYMRRRGKCVLGVEWVGGQSGNCTASWIYLT